MERTRTKQYPTGGNNNITQCTHGVDQALEHVCDPYIEALLLHALYGVVKGKKHRRLVLWIHPLEKGLTPHG